MSVKLTQQCSAPPSSSSTSLDSSAPQQCQAPPPQQTSLNRTDDPPPTGNSPTTEAKSKGGYTTLNNWGPVVKRTSTGSCTIKRTIQPYASEKHNPEKWEKIVAPLELRRREYEQYNTNVVENNTIIGNNQRRANYGEQYNCDLGGARGSACTEIPITSDGTLAASLDKAETTICMDNRNEILGIESIQTESECASKCSSNKQCAGFTVVGTECILQNASILTKNPGFVLGQYTEGIQTKIRHCHFENGECVEEIPKAAESCHGPFPTDRFSVASCLSEVDGLKQTTNRLQVLVPFRENKYVEPGVPPPANRQLVIPRYEKNES